ncbi:MAG: ubiquitin carboxyl-terminal hydrolase [Puniceicoccales bacterium]|nr:ubiquitin carboxyl-terminal hydrolase [Puniceicoccales bacterium]
MTAVKNTEENFHGPFENFFSTDTKIAIILTCVTISVTTIAAGITFQMPALIYVFCAAVSIFCVVIAAYYWKKTSHCISSAEEAESIQLEKTQISTASLKNLIKPSKFNLRNCNNHCYLNVALQLLFAIVPFRNEIIANSEGQLTPVVKKIFQYLATGENWNQLQVFDHDFSEIFAKIVPTYFANGRQEDAVGLLEHFLEIIEKEIHSTKLLFDVLSLEKEDIIEQKDDFYHFRTVRSKVVRITASTFFTLEQSLHNFTKEDFLTGENQIESPNGKKTDTGITYLFQEMPPFLLFQLERFDWISGKMEKLSNDFLFPESIDMAEFMVDNTTPCKYKLAGMACHRGTNYFGHYLTYILSEDGESFMQLDSLGNKRAAAISKEKFMKHEDFIKNSYLALYVHIE